MIVDSNWFSFSNIELNPFNFNIFTNDRLRCNNIGNISFYDSKQSDYNFTKPYSDSTAEKIDSEVKRIVDSAYERTKNLLLDKKEQLEKIANELLEKEILFQNDLETLIGKRPFERKKINEDDSKDGVNKSNNDKPSAKEEE